MGHNMSITFGRPPPKIWEGEKKSKIQRDFWQLRLWSRISPEWLQISKIWKKCDRERFLPRSRKKVRWTLVHKQKFYWLELSHPSEFLGGDYISVSRGFCALRFIHVLEIAQALIAHTRSGTGSPPQKKNFDFDREYLLNYSRYPKSERNVIDSDSFRVPRKKSGELLCTNKKVLLARI